MKIGIAGAGGIGSNVARHLAQAGMPHLFLVDFDEVAPGNLNRQFYSINQVGCPKVDCLKQNLLNIHPTMRVETLNLRLKPGSMARIFSGCDVVVEGLDDPAAKKQLVEALAPSRTPVVSASGIAGHDMDTITVRTIGNCHMVGDFSTDIAHAPLFPPKIAMIAAQMARIVLRLQNRFSHRHLRHSGRVILFGPVQCDHGPTAGGQRHQYPSVPGKSREKGSENDGGRM